MKKIKTLSEPYDLFNGLTEEEKQQSKWYAEGYSDALKERKTGKWLKMIRFTSRSGDPVWCCSECGKGVHVFGIKHNTYNYDIAEDHQWVACPNCGALMLEEE